MIDYVAILNQKRKSEEQLILEHLNQCTLANIKYDLFTLEMPVYIEFEPTHNIPRHEFLGFENPKPKIPKRKKKVNEKYPPPLTHYRIHHYRNEMTGNTITVSESTKKKYDKNHIPYNSMRVTFRSENCNVSTGEMQLFIFHIMKQYHFFIENIKNYQNSHELEEPSDIRRFNRYPFHIYYSEPRIDIKGPEHTIDFLHKNFIENLYMTRFRKHDSIAGDKPGKKRKKDRRIFDNQKPTKYISKRVRLYPYTLDGEHYLRFEFKFDKAFLKNKQVLDLESYSNNFNPIDIWQKRCFFFMFNLPKIEGILKRKHPELVESFLSYILNKQYKDDGSEVTEWDKLVYLRDYEIEGKKLFKASREYLLPKWFVLHKFITDALSQLSLYAQPSLDVKTRPVEIVEIIPNKRNAKERIIRAVMVLKERGEKVTWNNVMKEAGIKSTKTIAKNKDLLKAA